jgi:GT2 family glycosyltransferase
MVWCPTGTPCAIIARLVPHRADWSERRSPGALAGLEDVISVVVVDFRSSDLALSCVRSLLAGTLVPDEILIIDNESRGRQSSTFGDPIVRALAIPDNMGYSTSCNLGASATSGDVILFLNADVTVDRDCLARCVRELASAPDIGIVTCRLVRLDGSLDHACHRGLPTPLSSMAYKTRMDRLFPKSHRLGRYTMSWLDPRTVHDVEACSGAFMLMPRAVLDEAGGWDERYRFYAEDLDLCLRVSAAGRRIRYLGDVTATHVKGAFSKHLAPDGELDPAQRSVKRRVRREIARSHRLFFEEHMRSGSTRPVRAAIRLAFALQEIRLEAADRMVRP